MQDSFASVLQSLAHVPPPRSLVGKRALITGVTSGIGLATALALLKKGVHVIGVGRRQDRLSALSDFVRGSPEDFTGRFQGITADATAPGFINVLRQEEALSAEIVICNAGLARGLHPASELEASDVDEMIATNLSSVITLVRAVLPEMKQRGRGSIVGVSSIAAHQSYENGNVYCATKAALRAFLQCVRQETCGQNIRINMISPGLVETEFSNVRFKGDTARAKAVYTGLQPLTGADIASEILHILERPDHVNIDDMIILPVSQGSVTKVVRQATAP